MIYRVCLVQTYINNLNLVKGSFYFTSIISCILNHSSSPCTALILFTMSFVTTISNPAELETLRLTASNSPDVQDWETDLARDGYAVIKGAVTKAKAAEYADRMYTYLEGFGLGFDRKDRSTWTGACLPNINNKGMCLDYAVAHEDFVWEVRAEPGVVGTFEKVLGTKDLIVSFDAVNFGLAGRKDLEPNVPWPHQGM